MFCIKLVQLNSSKNGAYKIFTFASSVEALSRLLGGQNQSNTLSSLLSCFFLYIKTFLYVYLKGTTQLLKNPCVNFTSLIKSLSLGIRTGKLQEVPVLQVCYMLSWFSFVLDYF